MNESINRQIQKACKKPRKIIQGKTAKNEN